VIKKSSLFGNSTWILQGGNCQQGKQGTQCVHLSMLMSYW
jgi:hypothetical protein